MTGEVILFVQEGRLTAEKEFSFTKPGRCVIGRARDADIRLGPEAGFVSRHHCALEINPPDIRIRDLGSLNGTYVNGMSIGQRGKPNEMPDTAPAPAPWHALHAGDVIRMGSVRIRVTVLTARTARIEAGRRFEVSGAPQPHVTA